MRRYVLVFLSLVPMALLMSGCSQPSDTLSTSPDVRMEMSVEPDPPAAGEATLVISLRSANGTPIDGATVTAHGDMDHAGMTPVEGATDTSTNGIYRVPFAWTMGGGWIVEVTAQLPDDAVTSQTFELFVEAMSSNSVMHQADSANDQTANANDAGEN